MLPPSLAPLADYPQFVAWRIEMRPNKQNILVPTKVPYSPIHGGGASHSKPSDWGTYEQAVTFQTMCEMPGVGFVFSENDPFFFLDIDKALKPDGTWSLIAQELCARFPNAGKEVSQSGTGIHIIGTCAKGFEHSNKNVPLNIEFYTKQRFCALTGNYPSGLVTTPDDAAVARLVTDYFTRDPGERITEWTTEPVPEWRGPESDEELISRMLASGHSNATSAFGGGSDQPTFADLFSANADVLGRRWPPNPNSGDAFDHSSADQSMANLLAFWTGKNCERIERIMRMSGLARAKWDMRDIYLSDTIQKAAGFVQKVYIERGSTPATPSAPPPPPPPPEDIEAAGFQQRPGGMHMLVAEQLQYFADCIYVTNINRIMVPNGDLLDMARFDAVYGGHEFILGKDGRKTTRSAWEAFTRNQNFQQPTADRLCFRPEHGSGGIIKDSGKVLANAYVAATTEETEGDPGKMLEQIRKMLPNGNDMEILLTYMASVKQNPGMKAQWWPVIQGVEGNFKTALLEIMSFAVGSHYSHLPNMEKMVSGKSNFNGWIDRKLFLGLEEVRAANRWEFFEGFKTTVTNMRIPIEGKGIEELTGDNRANGMITTNHQDGVPVIGKTRRYAAFFCAQQTEQDLVRDGMTKAYRADLHNWLYGKKKYKTLGPNYGLRVMNWYLARKPLDPDLDPNQLCIHCPDTTSTQAAMEASRGRIEQDILEAVEEERAGFAGGWISSMFLDRFLSQKGFTLANQKRREVMQSIGYDLHPALPTGRTVNAVKPDDGKPRLFVKLGTPAAALQSPAEVAKAYSDAQLKIQSDRSAAGVAFRG